jgi:D-threo-aldose 1-dehydrogenase
MSFDPAVARKIGRRHVAVSQLGVGTLPFGSHAVDDTDASIGDAFAAACDAGLRYFDTAPLYGLGVAEHRLEGGAAPGVHAGVSPFTVEFDYSYDGTLRSLEASLQRLGTNTIDIVLIHDVNRRWQGDLVEQRYREAMQGAHHALSDLRAAGTIKAFGVGVNDWEILLRFAADGDFDCFMLAGRYTLLDHTSLELFMPECERRGISVLMAAPFNSGILATGAHAGATYFYAEADVEIMARTKRIEGICERHRVAIAAAALQFALAHPAVSSVVTGMRSRREVDANVAHCRASIPADFWAELKSERLIAADAPVPAP